MQRRHERQIARARALGVFESRKRRMQALGTDLEVGLLVEHVCEQRADRGAATRLTLGGRDTPGRVRQIAVQTVEGLEQLDDLGVAREALQLALPLADERSRQSAIAVQRRGAPPPAAGP